MDIEEIRNYSIFLLKTHGGLPLAASEALSAWYTLAKEQNLFQDQIHALVLAGGNWLHMNRSERALGHFQQALALINEHANDNAWLRLIALANLAVAYDHAGEMAESLRFAEEVWANVDILGESPQASQVALLLSKLHIGRSDWAAAYAYSEEALARFTRAGDENGRSKALNNMGLICVETGKYREAETLLLEALELKNAVQDVAGSVYTMTELGRLYYVQGDLGAAVHYSRQALQVLWENVAFMDKVEVARLCRLYGAVASMTGDRQGAITYLQRAITYFAQLSQWREWSESTKELDIVIRSAPTSRAAKVGIEWRDKEILRNLTTLLGLMDTLEGLYPELRGKSELVTKYALSLGDAIDLNPSTRESLSHAARLANIGVTFPSSDLNSRGVKRALDDENPHLAERVLSMVSVSDECRLGIRHQNEWYDGSGQPDGLKRDEIPIISRILSIVNAYVTRATQGSFDSNLHQRAMQHLHKHAGAKFDAELVHKFFELHEALDHARK